MQEHETSDRLAAELDSLGYTVTRKIGRTGLVGTLRNGDGPVLLIRADMDALPESADRLPPSAALEATPAPLFPSRP